MMMICTFRKILIVQLHAFLIKSGCFDNGYFAMFTVTANPYCYNLLNCIIVCLFILYKLL